MKREQREAICKILFNELERVAIREIANHMEKGDYRKMWQAFNFLDLLLTVKSKFCKGVEEE